MPRLLGTVASVIARFLPTQTVDKAISGLNKAAELLAKAEAAQTAKADALDRQASNLKTQAVTARAEAERASRVRQNLAGLTI